jgi:D-tagatose-1,6-bisphosphate aldolase subunit GatZ/KbaZ
VIQAAIEEALALEEPVLIESTANQVNQRGGYTGMTPADFRDFVYDIADACLFPRERIILGGDHLGPHPWRDLPAEHAMHMAQQLVESYVSAGFEKIHLDTSMHLGGDNLEKPLDNEVIAQRGAQLCTVAERIAATAPATVRKNPVYVVGSEVPPPGGPQTTPKEVHPTSPPAFLSAYNAYKRIFWENSLEEAFTRIVAFVVQPGVEFVDGRIFDYTAANTRDLCDALKMTEPPIVFEGHSTDYQTRQALSRLVQDGVGILKVGPALTFALREGLLAMEAMENQLFCDTENLGKSDFSRTLEHIMLRDDKYWRTYYKGNAHAKYLQRCYSYYDRARYYLAAPEVEKSIHTLLENLAQTRIPEEMLSQHLPFVYEQLRDGTIDRMPKSILLGQIKHTLQKYRAAVKGRT